MIKNLITLLFFLGTAQVNAQLVILQYHHVDASTPPATSISPFMNVTPSGCVVLTA